MVGSVSRRSLVLSLLSSTGTAALTSSKSAAATIVKACRPGYPKGNEFSALVKNTPIVDIHCHIFNATDLPAYQFFERVVSLKMVFDDYLATNSKQTIYQLKNGQWNTFYRAASGRFNGILDTIRSYEGFVDAYPLDRLLLTPGFDPEMALLDALIMTPPEAAESIELRFVKALAAQKKQKYSESHVFLRQWFRYLSIDWNGIENVTNTQIADAAEKMRSRNFRFRSSNTSLDSALRFLTSMCQSRTENFLRLRKEYDIDDVTTGGAVRLFTPALVDFDYWVDGPQSRKNPDSAPSFLDGRGHAIRNFPKEIHVKRPRATLSQQVEMMGKLSELFPGECHSYFPYCPWRQVAKTYFKKPQETPITLLERAINKHGFIGVKLYPPMGFRPINNGIIEEHPNITKHMFPDHLYEKDRFAYVVKRNPGEKEIDWKFRVSKDFGAKLDQALDELYKFCVTHNLPIMTHAAPSNFSGGYDYVDGPDLKHNFFAEKAAIAYWQSLVNRPDFKTLRLNLGHSGFRNEEWNKQLAEILKSAPNTYADLSYFEEILGGKTSESACTGAEDSAKALKAGFKAHTGLASRFMYGSDWYMMTQERFSKFYLDIFARLVYERVADAADRERMFKGLMAGNASRFLGLNLRTEDSNYTRLEAFFESKFGKGSARAIAALDRIKTLADIADETA